MTAIISFPLFLQIILYFYHTFSLYNFFCGNVKMDYLIKIPSQTMSSNLDFLLLIQIQNCRYYLQ